MGAMHWLGEALGPLRPGVDALKSSGLEPAVRMSVTVTSEAFSEGDGLPRWATADGEGRFPGVSWDGLPRDTASVVLLVEDADIPFVRPVTHLIVHSIPPSLGGLEAGAIGARLRGPSAAGWACGRNFLGATGWTPPSPPPGHGPHRYAFQVFALGDRPVFPYPPGRAGLMRRIRPSMLAQGRLIGTYERV